MVLILILLASNTTWGQVAYPFNPDSDGDTLIGAGDLLSTLSAFGSAFQPNAITLDSIPLELVLTNLIEQVSQLQAQILELESTAMTADSVFTLSLEKKCFGLDLSGAELLDADLFRADFSGSNLSNSNLTDSDLVLANFYQSNLTNTNLTNTDMYQVNLIEANLSNANFYQAFLGAADLTGATIEGANFQSTYLTGATMSCLVGCPTNLPGSYVCIPDEGCSESGRFKIQED
ncbi:pentapeptide repeat-containing protein [Flavobacteriales bacterium]|nr:pentapeptide repeat-containing protein [bacterium]MDA9864240.1 pentapeptide repeat-containing protein [Flavobacteriales bacterium]